MTFRICHIFASFLAFSHTLAYNRPGCDVWPSDDVWQAELGTRLSKGGASLLTVSDNSLGYYQAQCDPLGVNPYALATDGHGICMQAPECSHFFCDFGKDLNLPAYTVNVQTVDDIQAALEFANKYDIAVSVKTSGHSFHGGSSVKDSMLIWMKDIPKDLNLRTVSDTCGTQLQTVGIGAGALWDDVIEAVKRDYHMVTGGCRSVSAAGGWLMGVGLSYTSRKYGLGIDQVVSMDVVLSNGTLVKADACTNTDLFWALRGGGGGTFGIVTHVDYKVYPVTPITVVQWFFNEQNRPDLVRLWLSYWTEVSLTLEDRWGGFFNGAGCHLVFTGVFDDANQSFIASFSQWYYDSFVPLENSPGASTAPASWQVNSWYDYKGGPAAYQNPFTGATPLTGPDYEGFAASLGARLVPHTYITNITKRNGLVNLLVDLVMEGTLSYVNYFFGGSGMSQVPINATAVHPAMRSAIYHIAVQGNQSVHDRLRAALPNSDTGVSFNHHNAYEPQWRNALWGSHYDRLSKLKTRYDPYHRFNCALCGLSWTGS